MDDPSTIIEAARLAGSLWAAMPPRKRREVLSDLGSILASHQETLVSAIVADTGKPPLEALGGDFLVTIEYMRYCHRHAHKILAPRRLQRDWILFRSTRFTQTFEPHGVALIYGAANYPLQLALVPAITALYAGNAVVLKLSEQTPDLAEVLQTLVDESDLPDKLLQIVSDPPELAGRYVDERPDFICFTGSTSNGVKIAERAARHVIPVLLELGGKDAAIVFGDCVLDRTIEGILYGAFANSGQVCVGVKRLYIEQTIYKEFAHRLVERAAQLRVSSDSAKEFDVAPIRSEPLLARLSSQISDALSRGAEILTAPRDVSGAVPLILANVPADAQILREEAFGPVLCIAPFRDEAQAIELANESSFALGASIWTGSAAKARRIVPQLRAANITVNDVIRNVANPAAPFGGNGLSGYGRYHGPEGLHAFSRIKTTMISSSQAKREINWFPFTAKTYRQLSKLIHIRHRSFLRRLFWMLIPLALLAPSHAQIQPSLSLCISDFSVVDSSGVLNG